MYIENGMLVYVNDYHTNKAAIGIVEPSGFGGDFFKVEGCILLRDRDSPHVVVRNEVIILE